MPAQHKESGQAGDDYRIGPNEFSRHRSHASLVSSDLYYDEPCVMLIGMKGNLLLTRGQQLLFSTLLQAGGAPVSAQTLASRLAVDSFAPLQIKTVRNAISLFRRRLILVSTTVRIDTRYNIGYCLKIDPPAP